MLNARRHRRGDHATGQDRPRRASSAQRPKASARRSLELPEPRHPRRCCAQRPKASARRSPLAFAAASRSASACSTPEGIGAAITFRELTAARLSPVLNARRHRRGDHALSSRVRSRSPLVLNARRHRRGDHAASRSIALVSVGCSTPEGIGAAITFSAGTKDVFCSLCSTPEGIGAAITAWATRRSRPHGRGAQRPKASARRSLRAGEARAAICRVLNARRHRRGDHACVLRARVTWAACAQRPKASARRSLAGSDAEPDENGCSTPEGIGAAITRGRGACGS